MTTNKKLYVLDTNVLLSDPACFFSFACNDILLPMIVLEELDKHKIRQDEVGRNARETVRKFSFLTQENKDFKNGIPLGEGKGLLKVVSVDDFDHYIEIPLELGMKTADNQILCVCLGWKRKHPEDNVVLASKDVLLRLKAEALGIVCEDYTKEYNSNSSGSSLYSGVSTFIGEVDLDSFYKGEKISLPKEFEKELHPNQFVILKKEGTDSSGVARWYGPDKGLVKVTDFSPCRLEAKNKEQKFALDLLMDTKVSLVTLAGVSGGGKTLCAMAAGLHQVLETKRYSSLVICRPMEPVGRDIGYLPGTKDEKIDPWINPIRDSLRHLLTSDGKKSKKSEETMQMLFEKGTLEVEILAFIRGRTISNAFILIDEAQNISLHEIKTILTRAGEGSKIVLTGDISQIDTERLDALNNGLTVTIEKFKEYDLSGHVTFKKGERSKLATLSSEIL